MKEWGLLVKEVDSNKAKALENKQTKIIHSILQLISSTRAKGEKKTFYEILESHFWSLDSNLGQASQMHWTKVPLSPTAQPGKLRGTVEDMWRTSC